MRDFTKPLIVVVLLIIITSVFINVFNDRLVEDVEDHKIIDLQQHQIISGTDGDIRTEMRYLVVTDKETFICENSILNGKFNNSDIFFRLKKDSIYNFKVVGFGKGFFTDYRNIIEIKK